MRLGAAVVMQRSDRAEEADFTSAAELEDLVATLGSMGHTLVPVDFSTPLPELVEILESSDLGVILNTIELVRGETRPTGLVPSICSLMGIGCTGPDAHAIMISSNKWLTKRVVAAGAVRFAPDLFVSARHRWDPARFLGSYPVILKPNFGGSSQGIGGQSVARTPEEVAESLETLEAFRAAGVLIESFIPGQDITVGCIETTGGWKVLTPIRYETPPTNGDHYITQTLKTWAGWSRVSAGSADLAAEQRRELEAFALEIVTAVGARGVARVDFRLADADGALYALEINAIAAIESNAGLALSAEGSGVSHEALITRLLASGQKDNG